MRALTHRLFLLLPLAVLLFGVTACDSSDDDATDSELFVGSWVVDETMDGSGSVDLPAFSDTFFDFSDSGTATISAVGVDPNDSIQLSGAYAVNEATSTITVSITITGLGTVPLAATAMASTAGAMRPWWAVSFGLDSGPPPMASITPAAS